MPADSYFDAAELPSQALAGRRPRGGTAGRFRVPESDQAAILAALPAQDTAGLYLEYDARGDFPVLRPPGPGAQDQAAIEGKAIPDGKGGWYLGCQTCKSPIGTAAAGTCEACRHRLAEREKQEDAMWADLRGDRQP